MKISEKFIKSCKKGIEKIEAKEKKLGSENFKSLSYCTILDNDEELTLLTVQKFELKKAIEHLEFINDLEINYNLGKNLKKK